MGPPLANNYTGPYVVLVKGLKVFKIQLGERTEVDFRDRMKLYVGQAPPLATQPPRRGLATRAKEQFLTQDSEDLGGVQQCDGDLKIPVQYCYFILSKFGGKNPPSKYSIVILPV